MMAAALECSAAMTLAALGNVAAPAEASTWQVAQKIWCSLPAVTCADASCVPSAARVKLTLSGATGAWM